MNSIKTRANSGCSLLPLMSHVASDCRWKYTSSMVVKKVSRFCASTFKMIDKNDVSTIPHSLFNISNVKVCKDELEIDVEQYSDDDPEVEIFWVGSINQSWPKKYPRSLSVYLTGGKVDKPKEVKTTQSFSWSFPKLVESKINLNLRVFAKIIKDQNDKFDNKADVIFYSVHPGEKYYHIEDVGRNKLVHETKKSFEEISRIKFLDFMSLAV